MMQERMARRSWVGGAGSRKCFPSMQKMAAAGWDEARSRFLKNQREVCRFKAS